MTEFRKDIRSAIQDHFTDLNRLESNRRELSKGVQEGLVPESQKELHHEMEFRYGTFTEGTTVFDPEMGLNKFKQIISTLRKLSLMGTSGTASSEDKRPENLRITEQKDSTLTLDISLKQTKFLPAHLIRARATVPNEKISNFCLTSNIDDLEVKSTIVTTNITDWNMRLQSSDEKEVTDARIKSQFGELVADPRYLKSYRLKKRRSFFGPPIPNMIGPDGNPIPSYRVDATIVKKSVGSTYELSNIYGAKEHYELEVESDPEKLLAGIPVRAVENRAQKYYDSVIGILEVIKRAFDDTPVPVSEGEKQAVLLDYMVSFFNEKDRQNLPKSINERRFFIGMEVNPLEPKHLAKNQKGEILLLDGAYYITMKADGTRDLLYFPIPGRGRGYLIDRNMNVRYSGLERPDLIGAAFDGEYIDDRNEFLIFDYLIEPGGKDIRDLKFSERYKRLNNLKIPSANAPSISPALAPTPVLVKDEHNPGEPGLITPEGPMKLKVKEHILIPKPPKDSDKPFEELGNIIERIEKSPTYKLYRNDGYVWTPDEAYPIASLKQAIRWPKLLKWKPIDQLSNDFLIQKELDPQGQPRIFLGVGATKNKFQTLNLLSGYERGVTRRFSYPQNFIDGTDNVARVLIDPDGQIRTVGEDKQVIYDDSVVEFVWGPLPQGAFTNRTEGWIPIRVREDKSQTKTPNRIDTAQSNWKLIKYPIDLKMLKGETEIPTHYYLEVDERLRNLNANMRRFHNVVKRDLILGAAAALRKEEPKTPIRILDLGVGKGGDIDKWFLAKAKSALGIDLYKNGLEDGGGAFDRLEADKSKFAHQVDVDLVWGDVSKNIFTLQAAQDEKYRNILQLSLEKNAPGFNIITIMFALHYFMIDEQHLRGLFQNISELLVPGGYLIGITLDDKKVLDALRGKSILAGIEPRQKIKLWHIRKDFKEAERAERAERAESSESPESSEGEIVYARGPLGRKISVYQITIGQEIPEYLTNFAYLTEIAAEYGLEPVEFGNFKQGGDLSNYVSPNLKQPIKMSKAEQEYNDLNRYFIFQKVDKKPSLMERERVATAPSTQTAAEPTPAPSTKAAAAPSTKATAVSTATKTTRTTSLVPSIRRSIATTAATATKATTAAATTTTATITAKATTTAIAAETTTTPATRPIAKISRMPIISTRPRPGATGATPAPVATPAPGATPVTTPAPVATVTAVTAEPSVAAPATSATPSRPRPLTASIRRRPAAPTTEQ